MSATVSAPSPSHTPVRVAAAVSPSPIDDPLSSTSPRVVEPEFSLGQMSSACARRWPSAPALHDGDSQLSFAQLDGHAEALAHRLVALGVKKGHHVGIVSTKELTTVVAILGACKAGAVYVPIDPNLPERRLAFILCDASPSVIVGRAAHASLGRGRPYLELDAILDAEPVRAKVALPSVSAKDTAYIMYTSGSTGYPKGVMVQHGALETFFRAHNSGAEIEPGDRCMNTGPFHFDVSILDVFLPLYCGACVHLTPELPMPKLLLQTVQDQRITHFYAVGTILAILTGDGRRLDRYDLSSLKMLQTGAEVCNAKVVDHWLRRLPELGFLNSYGPTELTVGCAYYRKPTPGCLQSADVPIGRLHPGTEARILTDDGRVLAPVAAQGELAVAGSQCMQGYWRRPAEEQLVWLDYAGRRYYRTGDIVRADHTGQLHYVGRVDDEIKIDGLRIHPSEVKRTLEQSPHVANAYVFTMPGPRRKDRPSIGAAVVPVGAPDERGIQELLNVAAEELPRAAVPDAVLVCAELPTTPTGKADVNRCADSLRRAIGRTPGRKIVFAGEVPADDRNSCTEPRTCRSKRGNHHVPTPSASILRD